MRKHDCYIEVAADTPYDMGFRIGTAVKDDVWPATQNRPPLPPQKAAFLRGCMEETRQRYPGYMEEMSGYADGAGVALEDLWRLSLEGDMLPLEQCTTIVTNGGRFLAHNEDWQPAAYNRLYVLKRKLKGKTTLELHYGGTLGGNAVSITSGGFIQAINSHRVMRTDWSKPLIPTNVAARRVLDACRPSTVAQELDGIPRIAGYTHMLMDLHGRDAPHVVEATHDMIRGHRLESFPYAHANLYLSPDLVHLNVVIPPDFSTSTERLQDALCLARPHMTEEEAMALLFDKSRGKIYSLMNEETIGSIIVNLDARKCLIWMRREADKGWIEYPLNFLDEPP